ncbi:NACHT domain-containing protein [Leptospira kmetyi]|uniref:ATP-binding protein n=1 Tax=Leptospira kmetyi TaxID=408139 RepID=A0ABX4N4T4_9LEPT|nr:ATP-binding protein [Leptospira kmetyi]PJZ28408.1 hypothetical protein CH378_18220 [Leptospira kmetyi]
MTEVGGAADKLGNTFETLWSLRTIIRLLTDDLESILFEPKKDSEGIEFVATRSSGKKEFHSVKFHSAPSWGMSDLTSVKKGRSVFWDLFKKNEKDPNSISYFISTANSRSLGEFTKLAKEEENQSSEVFQSRLTSKSERKDFEKFKKNLEINSERAIKLLSHLEYRIIDIKTLEEEISALFPIYMHKRDTSVFNLNELFGVFWKIREEKFGSILTKQELIQKLEKNDYEISNWNLKPGITEKISNWNLGFKTNNRVLGTVLNSIIPRKEAEELFSFIETGEERVLFLTGVPGIGKSEILVQLQDKIEEAKIPIIAFSLKHGLAEYEYLKNDLSEKPEIVLSGIAKEKKSILIIDGLDSIARLSGDHSDAWLLFSLLIRTVVLYHKNIILVIGCRKFDFTNDPSIRSLSEILYEVESHGIEIEQVDQCLIENGINKSLTNRQKEILQNPLFLRLFLEGDRVLREEYSNPEDIFQNYWEAMEKKFNNGIGNGSLDSMLTDVGKELIKSEKYSFSRRFIKNAEFQEFLLRENFILEIGDEFSFFHPLLQDYVIARYFTNGKLKLAEYIAGLDVNQKLRFGLKARSILSIHRRGDLIEYQSQLEESILKDSVPLFVKAHIVDWLSHLTNPLEEEWEFLRKFISPKGWAFRSSGSNGFYIENILNKLKSILIRFEYFANKVIDNERKFFINKLLNRIPFESNVWFSLAEKKQFWLVLEDATAIEETINFAYNVRASNFTHVKSDIISRYIETWSKQKGKEETVFLLFEFANIAKSKALQDVLLRLIDDGFFDQLGGTGKFHFLYSDNLSEKLRIEILVHSINRIFEQNSGRNVSLLFKSDERFVLIPNVWEFKQLLKNDFLFYAKNMYPILLKIIRNVERENILGLDLDEIWPYFFLNHASHRKSEIFLDHLILSLSSLAKNSPVELDEILGNSYLSKSRTISYLLFHSLSENPGYFYKHLFDMILDEPNRLLIGDNTVFGLESGNFHLIPPRKVINCIYNYLSDDQIIQLEDVIFNLPIEFNRRYLLLILLNEIPIQFRSQRVQKENDELLRRYPTLDLNRPSLRPGASFVGSPIEDYQIAKMKDRQWIRAMKKYDASYKENPKDFLKGDGRQLASALGQETEKDPKRFIELLLNSTERIEDFYFSNVLRGAAKSWKGKIDIKLLFRLVEKAHNLVGYPCLRDISSVVSELAEEEIPVSILEIIKVYANVGKDPWKEVDIENENDPDYISRGINSDRGSIAWTIGKLIEYEPKRKEFFLDTIEQLVIDSSTSVRACVLIPLFNLLTYDSQKAVELFLKLVDGRDELLKIVYADRFLEYAARKHYIELREKLNQMIVHQDGSIQEIGAKHIFYCSYQNDFGKEDLSKLKLNKPYIRKGIVSVATEVLHLGSFQDRSKVYIRKFFNDPSKDIRFRISFCFENLEDAFFKDEDWIKEFIHSLTFLNEPAPFLKRIKELPRISEAIAKEIGKVGLYIYLKRQSSRLLGNSDLIDILLTSYDQSENVKSKSVLFKFLDNSLLWNQAYFLDKLEIDTSVKRIT